MDQKQKGWRRNSLHLSGASANTLATWSAETETIAQRQPCGELVEPGHLFLLMLIPFLAGLALHQNSHTAAQASSGIVLRPNGTFARYDSVRLGHVHYVKGIPLVGSFFVMLQSPSWFRLLTLEQAGIGSGDQLLVLGPSTGEDDSRVMFATDVGNSNDATFAFSQSRFVLMDRLKASCSS